MTDWIQAFAAVATLFVAYIAYKTSKDLYRVEAERDEEAATRRREAQARLIASWPSQHKSETNDAYGVIVANNSEQVIRKVEVEAVIGHASPSPLKISTLPPGKFFFAVNNSGWSLAEPLEGCQGQMLPITRSARYNVTKLSFRDMYDNDWTLQPGAGLQPATQGA